MLAGVGIAVLFQELLLQQVYFILDLQLHQQEPLALLVLVLIRERQSQHFFGAHKLNNAVQSQPTQQQQRKPLQTTFLFYKQRHQV